MSKQIATKGSNVGSFLKTVKKHVPGAGSGTGRFAFLLDGTGSMHSLIADARAHIAEIIARVKEDGGRDIRFQFIVYRDYDDPKLLEISELSDDQGYFVQWLARIVADGGADKDEAIEAALRKADDTGGFDAVFVAGDAPSHSKERLRSTWNRPQAREAREWARIFGEKGVPIHTLLVGQDPDAEADLRRIAQLSGGQFGRLDGSGAMRDMAVMAMLSRLKGSEAVRLYLEKHATTPQAREFGNRLLLENKRP